MSYRRDLKRLRRARKLAKQQQRQLAELELTGLIAITLHARDQQLTIAIDCPTGAPFTDTLREALRDRRQVLQQEARQLRAARQEHKRLRHQPPA